MKKLLIGLLVVVALIAALGFLLPTAYEVERSVAIQAPPAAVHAYVGELRQWPSWAPWHEDDATIVTTYGPTTTGIGAHQSWTSESGDGELTFTQCDPATGVAYDMAFLTGASRAPATCALSYAAQGDSTVVTWSMHGDVADMLPPVAAGYMNLMMGGMLGDMFDRGLAKLKTTVEAQG